MVSSSSSPQILLKTMQDLAEIGNNQNFTRETSLELFRKQILEANFDFGISPRMDDAFLSRFLRLRNGNIEGALNSLRKYYRNIHENRDCIGIEQPSNFTDTLESKVIIFLKNRCDGRRIILMNFQNWDPNRTEIRHLRLAMLYQAEYVSMETETQDLGVVLIIDFSGISFSHIRHLTFKEIKRSISMIQGGMPIKMCEIHVANIHYMAAPLISVGLTLLKTKLRNRLFLHHSNLFEELHRYIDPKILPLSLGGSLEDDQAYDVHLIQQIILENVNYAEFWNPEQISSNGLCSSDSKN